LENLKDNTGHQTHVLSLGKERDDRLDVKRGP
jgi:hypothetical protein